MATSLKNYLAPFVSAGETTVFQANTVGVQVTVIGLNVANTNDSSTLASVRIVSGATGTYLIKNASIPPGNALSVLNDSKLVLEYGDSLRVTGTTNLPVDVIVSTVEVTP